MVSKAPSAATHVVNFITGNKNKLGEVKAILEPTIEVRSEAIDVIEVQGSLEEVTIAKCKSAAEQVKSPNSLSHTHTRSLKSPPPFPSPFTWSFSYLMINYQKPETCPPSLTPLQPRSEAPSSSRTHVYASTP